MKRLPDRLREVLERLPDAQALTSHVQKQFRAERKDRNGAARCSASHAYRKKNLGKRNVGHLAYDERENLRATILKIRIATKECPYCGKKIPAGKVTIDHFVPFAKGGMHVASNLVGCCRRCNVRKRDKIDWAPAVEWKMRQDGCLIDVDFG